MSKVKGQRSLAFCLLAFVLSMAKIQTFSCFSKKKHYFLLFACGRVGERVRGKSIVFSFKEKRLEQDAPTSHDFAL
jgi:hypothetical protein